MPSTRIVLSLDEHTKEGAFASVFCDIEQRIAYKAFKSHRHPSASWLSRERAIAEDELRRAVFRSQVRAYEIASHSESLSAIVPAFHGTTVIERILDEQGIPVSDHYLLECCYAMELIDGEPEKLRDGYAHVRRIKNYFRDAGIKFVDDASAFFQDNPHRIKIIDFAVADEYYKGELRLP